MPITCAECQTELSMGFNFFVAHQVMLTGEVAELPDPEDKTRTANAFVCPGCLAKVPDHAKHVEAKRARQPHWHSIIAIAPVDTAKCDYSAFGKAPVTGEYTFVKLGVFKRRLPKAMLEITKNF